MCALSVCFVYVPILPSCFDLLTGKVAHPAVTSMATWCKLGKKMSTVYVLHNGWRFRCLCLCVWHGEASSRLLVWISPKHLSSVQCPSAENLYQWTLVLDVKCGIGTDLQHDLSVCVYVRACVCVRVRTWCMRACVRVCVCVWHPYVYEFMYNKTHLLWSMVLAHKLHYILESNRTL